MTGVEFSVAGLATHPISVMAQHTPMDANLGMGRNAFVISFEILLKLDIVPISRNRSETA